MKLHTLIPTNQRPEILKEALVSFIQYLKNSSRAAKITILDDSRDSVSAAANRDLCAGLAGTFGGSLRCFGRAEREALSDRFNNSSRSSLFEFALGLPETVVTGHPGANRNVGLLLYAGRKVLSLDDDVHFRFLRFRDANGFAGNDDGIPLLLPLGSRKRLDKLTIPADWNPDTIDTVLGSSPSSGDHNGPVKLAMCGIYGGRWYTNPFSLCAVPSNLSGQIWRGKKEYETARTEPWALMLNPEISFSGVSFFVSTCFAYDGSELLPPFLPGIRSSDSLWAWMLRALYPESPICHLPRAIEHDQSIKRPFAGNDFTGIVPGTSEIMLLLLGFIRNGIPGTPDAAGVLYALGTGLSRYAGEPPKRRREILSELYLASLGSRIGAFRQRHEESRGKPRFWAADLELHLRLLRNEAREARPWLPREFRNSEGEKVGEEAFREYLSHCGELLCAWPAIWQRAADLNLSEDVLS